MQIAISILNRFAPLHPGENNSVCNQNNKNKVHANHNVVTPQNILSLLICGDEAWWRTLEKSHIYVSI
jgi:hypothetical protein